MEFQPRTWLLPHKPPTFPQQDSPPTPEPGIGPTPHLGRGHQLPDLLLPRPSAASTLGRPGPWARATVSTTALVTLATEQLPRAGQEKHTG